jgi:Fe-S-cluster containining protein
MPARAECARCGCCCFSAEPGYIRLYAVDLDRLGGRTAELTVPWGEQCAMRFEAGRCVALRSDGPAGRFSCAIHAERPDACRWLTPGSSACRKGR